MTHANPHAYARVPADVWSAAREDFLAGIPGDEAARRHGIGIDNFWKRAREDQWLRKDQPWSPSPEEDRLDLDAPSPDREAVIDKAWRRVALALDRGRSTEAARWMRVHAALVASARAEVREAERISAEEMRSVQRVAQGISAQAAATLSHIQAETLKYSGRDDHDPPRQSPQVRKVQSKNSAAPDHDADTPARPLTRAERRRQAALDRRR